MQRTRSLAIEVAQVSRGDHAEVVEVEVGVAGLEGVERPRDLLDAVLERRVPLRQLQLPSQTVIAILLANTEHVGVNDPLFAFEAGKSVDEADHSLSIERADENRADFAGGDEVDGGNDLAILDRPDVFLQVFNGAVFGLTVNGTDLDHSMTFARCVI